MSLENFQHRLEKLSLLEALMEVELSALLYTGLATSDDVFKVP